MSRNKGLPKTGGRSAGTPNKFTGTMKGFIIRVLEGNQQQFEEYLNKLPPKEFVMVYERLLQYIVPKQQNLKCEGDLPHEFKIMYVGRNGEEIDPKSIDDVFPSSEDEVDISRG